MVGHQAEGVHLVVEAFGPLLEQKIEAIAVLILEEDVLFTVTTKNYMVDCIGRMYAGFAGHGKTIPLKSPNAKPDPRDFFNGEKIDKVRVATTLGGKSETTYITKSGKEIKGELVAALMK
jgi:hypothetical protein